MKTYLLEIEALCRAFEHVKENHGSAGVDQVTISQFESCYDENLYVLFCELNENRYRPLPLLKILVDKGNGEARALCIPAVRDRVVQTAVLQIISPILEREFEDCSFGYRRGRSVKQAVQRVREYYERGFTWVIDADIDAFFDRVDHTLLLQKVRQYITDEKILGLIELWLKAEIWDGKTITTLETGIPQGSPISPILANLFLDELDEAFQNMGCCFVRYADDYIVLCKSPEEAQKARQLSHEILDKLHLELDEEDVVSFDHGFKYLGVIFVRSMTLVPYDRKKRERKVLYYPPPLDMEAYRRRQAACGRCGCGRPDKPREG